MQQFMIVFGWAFLFTMVLAILLPYFRGKTDLVSSWNFFLLGSLNFVGCGAIYTGSTGVQWAWYDDVDRARFIVGAIVCYLALFCGYFVWKFPRRLAARCCNRWPAIWGLPFATLLIIDVALALGAWFVPQLGGVTMLLYMAGIGGSICVLAYLLLLWIDRPVNVALLAAALVALIFAALLGVTHSISRRTLLDVFAVIPICFYWLRWRYSRPLKVIALAAACGIAGIFLTAGYSAVRWMRFDAERSFAGALKTFTEAMTATGQSGGRVLGLFDGNGAVEVSCIAIHRYCDEVSPEPFYIIQCVLFNPIPRAVWPTKPEVLGVKLPKDVGYSQKVGRINWGTGIVGHGFHEGGPYFGFLMLVFYGVLLGSLMRFFDELLRRQPNNPFLIGALCAITAHVIALSRGDVSYLLLEVIGGLIPGLFIPLFLRAVMGTGFQYGKDGTAAQEVELQLQYG